MGSVRKRSNPQAGQRHCTASTWPTLALLCVAALLTPLTSAAAYPDRRSTSKAAHLASSTRGGVPFVDSLLVDTRKPVFDDGKWSWESADNNELRRRAATTSATATANSASISASASPSLVTTTVAITVSVSATTTSSTTSSTTTAAASPLPSPFDGGLSNNFTNTNNGACPAFINNLLDDTTFQSCYPVSILLQSSTSFFEAEKSIVSTTQVLDAACSANATFCSSYLTTVAQNLTSSAVCGTDYALGNPIVTQAYLAMVSYQTVYSATCLKDPTTSVYCFANAVTNDTNPSSVYFYYLPLNSTLPGGTIPICGSCLKQTMAIYQLATANRKLPIANTYLSAAQQVNSLCGPNFANATSPNAIVTNSAWSATATGSPWLLSSMLAASIMVLLA